MRDKTKAALDRIVDCMTGADGGVQFVRLRQALEAWDEHAQNGDASAAQIIEVMQRFSRLIDVASRL